MADAQPSGAAGSNPADAGLPADQRVVPAPATAGQSKWAIDLPAQVNVWVAEAINAQIFGQFIRYGVTEQAALTPNGPFCQYVISMRIDTTKPGAGVLLGGRIDPASPPLIWVGVIHEMQPTRADVAAAVESGLRDLRKLASERQSGANGKPLG